LGLVVGLGKLADAPFGQHHGLGRTDRAEIIVGIDYRIGGGNPRVPTELLPI
jgi:hypothetical protein